MNNSDLHERLDDVFCAITPAPAPIEAAMMSGRRTRLRRRAVAVTGVIAAIAVAVSVPVSIRQRALPVPSTGSGDYTVTVQPPGRGSPAGQIAHGTVNGASWQLTADKPTRQQGQLQECVHLTGPLFGHGNDEGLQENCTGSAPTGLPASLSGFGSGTTYLLWGPVGSDVNHLTVTLTSGDVLTLWPVMVYGNRWIGFAVPDRVIRVVTAYSAKGEIASAVPFDGGTGYNFVNWLKPGQQGPARAAALIGSGMVDGVHWSQTVQVGPWGICETTPSGSNCWSTMTAESHFTGVIGYVTPPGSRVVTGTAGPNVTRIVVSLPGGETERVRLVTVDGTKYWAFGYPTVLTWTAYDAGGQAVAHGST